MARSNCPVCGRYGVVEGVTAVLGGGRRTVYQCDKCTHRADPPVTWVVDEDSDRHRLR